MEAFVHRPIDAAADVLWNDVPIALLLGTGAWFTLRFRMIRQKALFLGMKRFGSKGEPRSISSFRAFATGLASRVRADAVAEVRVAVRES